MAPGTFRIPEEDFNQYDKIYDASSAGQNKKFFTRHVYAIQPENDDFSIARMHEALKQLMDTVRENHSGALDDNALRFLRADLTIEEANAVTMIFPLNAH